jgi:hypothetical protein
MTADILVRRLRKLNLRFGGEGLCGTLKTHRGVVRANFSAARWDSAPYLESPGDDNPPH